MMGLVVLVVFFAIELPLIDDGLTLTLLRILLVDSHQPLAREWDPEGRACWTLTGPWLRWLWLACRWHH